MTTFSKVFLILTILFHAQGHAALQPAVLAAVAMVLVDNTLSRASARVHQVFPNTALEEPLAALTAYCTVMASWNEERGKNRSQ